MDWMKNRRWLVALAAASACSLAVACGDDDDDGGMGDPDGGTEVDASMAMLTAITISPDPVSIEVGATQNLTVTGSFDDGSMSAITTGVTFASDDDTVATVGSTGNVVAVAAGTTSITATVGELSDSVDVTVIDPGPAPLLAVDEEFTGRAGFGDGGAPGHVEDEDCPERGTPGAVGVCHRIRWDGAIGFTGAFWINGSGFDDLSAQPVDEAEEGEVRVLRFYAWGESGGERVEVGAGIPDPGRDEVAVRDFVTLTTEPQQFEVSLAGLTGRTDIWGAFIFALNNTDNPGDTEIYIDDIRWESAPDPSIALPFTVDEEFTGRAGFGAGEGGAPGHVEDEMCPERATPDASGACHRIQWDGAIGFTGAFWINGSGFGDLAAKPVALPPAGQQRVLRFYAWAAEDGEPLEVGAGIPDANRDGAAIRQIITLSTEPQLFEISLAGLAGRSEVWGPFIFALAQDRNPGGAEVYIDDIQWDTVVPLTELRPDPEDRVIAWNDGTPALREANIGGANVGDAEGASNYIIPFVLPTVPAGGFTEANLRVVVIATAGAGMLDLHGDLYGLPFRTAAAAGSEGVVLTSMFHADTTVDGGATLIVDDFLTGDTPGGNSPLETDAAGDSALVEYLNDQVDAGAVAGDYVYLRVSPDAAAPIGAGYTWTLSAAVDADAPPDRPILSIR